MTREGGDITAADMVEPHLQPSRVKAFYHDATVLVTGATGFLGQVLVEKLLRTCDVKKLYLLARPKQGKSILERLHQYKNDRVFERLRRERPDALDKIEMIEGDVSCLQLGLQEADRKMLISEVQVIFHAASTVHSNEKLGLAAYANVRGTSEMLSLARQMLELKSVAYISTAYSFCVNSKIDEVFYEPPMSAGKLLSLVETLDDDKLEKVVPVVLEDWPNTYTFTKAIAEDIVRREGTDLPIAIIRPSMVVGSVKEPVAGWINSCMGFTGISLGIAKGITRTLQVDNSCLMDVVPVDYVVNCTLTVAYETSKRSFTGNSEIINNHLHTIPIYNYVNGPEKPTSLGTLTQLGMAKMAEVPLSSQLWHPVYFPTAHKYVFLLLHLLLHLFPAYVVDAAGVVIGKKPWLVELYGGVMNLQSLLLYFTSRQWYFRNGNTQALWRKMNKEDKQLFEFDMRLVDWDAFFVTYTKGTRVYLLDDPIETVTQGIKTARHLKIAHNVLTGFLLFVFVQFLLYVCL